jgi:plastocyanin
MVRRALNRPWLTGGAAAVALTILAACAPAPVGGSQSQSAAGAGAAATDRPAQAGIDPKCTKATKVTINKTGGTYAFSPAETTIERGAALAVTNRSDAARTLSTSPDAGIVTSVVDREERQVIQFPDEGTFKVRSAGAVLRLTVSGDSGCGAPAHAMTIVAKPSGGYAFEPAKVTVAATENFAVTNKSGTAQTVVCGKDDDGGNSRLARGETQLLALDEPGRYTCTSVQHSSAKLTITVGAAS